MNTIGKILMGILLSYLTAIGLGFLFVTVRAQKPATKKSGFVYESNLPRLKPVSVAPVSKRREIIV
jgi:hypothetical protein